MRRGPVVDCGTAACRSTVPDSVTAIPESVRQRGLVECLTYVRTNTSSSGCAIYEGADGGNNAPVNAYTVAPVTVRTQPASATTALRAAQTLAAASNQNNPDTRFEQYFRPRFAAPLVAVCPERIPNRDPPGPNPVRNCIPNNRYQSSAEAIASGNGS